MLDTSGDLSYEHACFSEVPSETDSPNPALFGYLVGKCECGRCTCYPPGDSRVYGKTCECDDRRCQDLEGVVCGGNNESVSLTSSYVSLKSDCFACPFSLFTPFKNAV